MKMLYWSMLVYRYEEVRSAAFTRLLSRKHLPNVPRSLPTAIFSRCRLCPCHAPLLQADSRGVTLEGAMALYNLTDFELVGPQFDSAANRCCEDSSAASRLAVVNLVV